MATEQGGEDKVARLRVGIIASSARPGRQSKTVAEWVCAHPIPSLDLRLIDLADSGLPCSPSQYQSRSASTSSLPRGSGRSWSRRSMRSSWSHLSTRPAIERERRQRQARYRVEQQSRRCSRPVRCRPADGRDPIGAARALRRTMQAEIGRVRSRGPPVVGGAE